MQDKDGSDSNFCRSLWMWCHPACHDNVLEVIKDSFARSQEGMNFHFFTGFNQSQFRECSKLTLFQ